MPKVANIAARQEFLDAVNEEFGQIATITRSQVMALIEKHNLKFPGWFVTDNARKAGRGVYKVNIDASVAPIVKVTKAQAKKELIKTAFRPEETVLVARESLVPDRVAGYVPFGNYDDVLSILASGRFFTAYITGLSGNGKTLMIEEICAVLKRELIRVNITKETDEDDLIGGLRLINGETVWKNGPVLDAMERGAILLLDEIDLGDAKLMCLQPVLEGKSIFIKKINKLFTPTPGFNIVATANTKGRGSDDGRFVGTNVMNEAFLERFSVTFDQEYPDMRVEEKILNNLLEAAGKSNPAFANRLVKWASTTRKAFLEADGADLISTRRAVRIIEAFLIFGDEKKAISLCLNRFEPETKQGFLDLYDKLTESTDAPTINDAAADPSTETVTF